jgi:lysophospholipid acyltransferase (LPLAT)-like uncharacterized protein
MASVNAFVHRFLLPYVGLLFVRVLSATYRVRLIGVENERPILDAGGGLIYASWHQRFFAGIMLFAKRKPIAIMISQSRDGALIARIVGLLGWRPVRGSSTRGGKAALEQLKELAGSGYRIGHIVDGPKGPPGIVKAGLLTMAQFTGLPIVPTITSAQRKWVFKSWDRFMIPKAFSKVIISFGKGITIPATLDGEEFEAQRRLVEDRLRELYDETDRIWLGPERVSAIFARRPAPCEDGAARARAERPGTPSPPESTVDDPRGVAR